MSHHLNIAPLSSWIDLQDRPLVISGPCSAENEKQVMTTAREIAKIPQVKVFRSGLWKPRTRPHYFEGVGAEGLKWLKRVKEETGLMTAVEVASPQHVEICLQHEVDILWLGARTVVNPFSVQEITEVLKGVDIPVMIKNPISPDLKLWMGAIERVNQAGVTRLIAIHRGFYSLGKSLFRNPPMWEIPVELKRIIPEIPIITDPSHICGNRNTLYHISQKAMDLEMDGLMIEAHYNPTRALTDVEQQISPAELEQLLDKLVIRKTAGDEAFQQKLNELRDEVDQLDSEIIELLSKRLGLVEEIGKIKKEKNITILQIKRWNEVFKERLRQGKEQGLNAGFLSKFLEILHNEAIRIQNEELNG